MGEAVLISIRPKWCEKIATGEKTIEVRKTRPNMETPFKCYIYCTKPKYEHEDFICTDYPKPQFYGGQKVIGEFICDKIEQFDSAYSEWAYAVAPPGSVMPMHESKALRLCCEDGCLSNDDVISYFGDEDWKAYFWHISDLKIYDTPKRLDSFWAERLCTRGVDPCGCDGCWDCEKRPPQSWCYVEDISE